jgi:hypothetical protein
MQRNETQPELQTALVPPDAHLSCYSSVATTFYPTLIFRILAIIQEVNSDLEQKKYVVP